MKAKKLLYAATLILVRDGVNGLEVLMLERSVKSKSFGGAFVFPGGKINIHNDLSDLRANYTECDDKNVSQKLNVPEHGLSYLIGAIRECFEELGILIAYDVNHELLSLHDSTAIVRYAKHRKLLNCNAKTIFDICKEETIKLATSQLKYFSHWVTPIDAPQRFDTRFFVCKAPSEQKALIDGYEAVSHCWIKPKLALQRFKAGKFPIFFPTIKNLEKLAEYNTSDDLLTAASKLKNIPRILPMRKKLPNGGFKILMPDDAQYNSAEQLSTHY